MWVALNNIHSVDKGYEEKVSKIYAILPFELPMFCIFGHFNVIEFFVWKVLVHTA